MEIFYYFHFTGKETEVRTLKVLLWLLMVDLKLVGLQVQSIFLSTRVASEDLCHSYWWTVKGRSGILASMLPFLTWSIEHAALCLPRLPHPPGQVLVAQLCLTLCDPMDGSPPGSSVHGILQARILKWVAIPFSRGSSQPRDWTRSPALQANSLPSEPLGKPPPG